jgi:hypothetical protein
LLNEGIADLAERDEQTRDILYDRFASLYSKESNDLTADDISEFNLILAQLRFSNPSQQLVRLIGDVLADRGSNDYFTLKLIQRMRQAGVNLHINLSNHDGEFIHNYLDRRHGALDPHQSRSLTGLQVLESKSLVNHAEVDAIWRECYVPAIKVFDYHIDRSQTPPKFTLFSHAPVGLETVRACAAKIGVEYDESNADALAATIDQINVYCQEHLADGDTDFLELNSGGTTNPGWYSNGHAISIRHPFLRAMWNRFTGETDAHKTLGLDEFGDLAHCEKQTIDLGNRAGFSLAGVHGHEGPAPTTHANRYNLDTDLGKYRAGDANTTGDYVIYALAFMPRLDVVATADAALAAALLSLAPEAAAAADTDDATAPLLAQPGSAATALSDVERAQLTAAKAAYSTAITKAGCAVGTTPRHILNAFTAIVIDTSDSQAQREFKEHARRELHTAWQLQIARIGNTRHRNALWHFRQFERYIREQLADAAYDPAASHTHYNLQVMKAIIDETNKLKSACRGQDLIAAVNSLYNVYQQIQHDNRRWYHSIVGAPAVLRCAGSRLSAVKPAFLVHRGTPLPPRLCRLSPRIGQRIRMRMAVMNEQHSSLRGLINRVKRAWRSLRNSAVTLTVVGARKPNAAAQAREASRYFRTNPISTHTSDAIVCMKRDRVDRSSIVPLPASGSFQYPLNEAEQAAFNQIVRASRNFSLERRTSLSLDDADLLITRCDSGSHYVTAATALRQRIANSLLITVAETNPQLFHAYLTAFGNGKESAVSKAESALIFKEISNRGTTPYTHADSLSRLVARAAGGYYFLTAKRFTTRDVDTGDTHHKYSVTAGHFDRNGRLTITHCDAIEISAANIEQWEALAIAHVNQPAGTNIELPADSRQCEPGVARDSRRVFSLAEPPPTAAVTPAAPTTREAPSTRGQRQQPARLRRTRSLGDITAATGTVGLMPAPATPTTPPEAPPATTVATAPSVGGGGT